MILKITKKNLVLPMCLLVILSFFGCGKKPIKNNTTSMQKNVQEDITKDNKQKNNEVVSHKNEMNDANKLLQEYYVMNAKKDKVIEKNKLSDFEKFKNMDPRFATTVTLTNLNQSPVTSLSKILNNLGLLLEIQSGVMLTQNIPYQYNGNLYNYLDVLCKLNGIGFDYSSGKIILKAFDTKTYDISFVNVVQEYGVNINSSTSGDTSEAATTQNFNLKTEMTKADLWEQIQNELKAIISNEGYFVVNKSVGTVTVTDRLPFFNKIDNYISTLTKRLSKEVFLDVKVLEITYNNTKEQGIDWNALSLARYDGNKIGIRSNFISGSPDVFTNGASGLSSLSLPVLTVTNQQDVINFIAGFIQGKGNLSIKSQPRQLVLNGQPAVIPVGQIIKYISSISSES
jgi:MSHA biogenesis protein MshL